MLAGGKSRKEGARAFFELLVLKSHGYIDVDQPEPYQAISVAPKAKLVEAAQPPEVAFPEHAVRSTSGHGAQEVGRDFNALFRGLRTCASRVAISALHSIHSKKQQCTGCRYSPT